MAPKISLESKLQAIHQRLVKSATCFTLKDLESKPTDGAVKIRGSDVKGFLKNLVDEGQVQCEKIGTGNWYWAVSNDPNSENRALLDDLSNAKSEREENLKLMQSELARQEQLIEDQESTVGCAAILVENLEEHRKSFALLQRRLSNAKKQNGIAMIEEKGKHLSSLLKRLEKWEESLGILKSHLASLSGGDYSAVKQLLDSLQYFEDDAESSEREGKRQKTVHVE